MTWYFCFSFLRAPHAVFPGDCSVYSSTNGTRRLPLLHPSQHWLPLVLDARWTGVRCQAHCGLHGSTDKWYWASFQIPVGHWCIFFRQMPIEVLCPFLIGLIWLFFFFFPLFSCMSSLYILAVNSLSDIWFSKYFFQIWRFDLFILFIVSFVVQIRVCFFFYLRLVIFSWLFLHSFGGSLN